MKRIIVELEALQPIAHGDTHSGLDNSTNVRIFMRSGRMLNGVAAQVPDVSGNALRAVAFRIPLHDHLIEALGIERGTLPRAVMNLLYSGGSMASGSKAPTSEGMYGVQIRGLYPTLALLGGAVDSFILPRSKMRLAAWIVSRESVRAIQVVAPHLVETAQATSVFDLVSDETRVRGTGMESEGNQMIYTYETLAAGAQIVMEITLDAHATSVDAAVVALALERWDGYFGGQGRQGRGRLRVTSIDGIEPDASAYLAHVREHADAMRSGLITGTLGVGNAICMAS
jgi:hypothetical protein